MTRSAPPRLEFGTRPPHVCSGERSGIVFPLAASRILRGRFAHAKIQSKKIFGAPVVVILMGVTGSGKTTVGRALAARLGWRFADADDFHSAENVRKMSQGIPLDDADRAPWLAALREAIAEWTRGHQSVALACSVLRHSYREQLGLGNEVKMVYLRGSLEFIRERLRSRSGHFATEAILASQFEALEEPRNDEALVVSIDQEPSKIVDEILAKLGIAIS